MSPTNELGRSSVYIDRLKNDRFDFMSFTMKFLSLSTFLLATATFAGETEGPEFFAFGYEAYISENDLKNSAGMPLGNAALVIQQDRANVHRFGLVDEMDEVEDLMFHDPELRAQIPALIDAAGGIDPELARQIMNGNVLIRVDSKAMGNEDGSGLVFTRLIISEHS
jgi:hypothetical protein